MTITDVPGGTPPGDRVAVSTEAQIAGEVLAEVLSGGVPFDPRRMWDRARTALMDAALMATNFDEFVSTLCRDLQVEPGKAAAARIFRELAPRVHQLGYRWFASYCERCPVAVVAVAQEARDAAREARS